MSWFGRGDKKGKKKNDQEDEYDIPRDFLIYRNGEEKRPQNFTYEPKKHRTWEDVLHAITEVAPPKDGDDRVEYLYTPRGRKENRIRDLEQLQVTITDQLVACGKGGYKDIDGGYERLNDHRSYDFSSSDYDSDASGRSQRWKKRGGSDSDRSTGGRGRDQRGGGQDDRRKGDGQVAKGYQKKKDKDLLIFLFQNGKGYRASPRVFYDYQLKKGMKYIMEELGRMFRVKNKITGIFCLAGHEIQEVEDLQERGAYVLVSKNEKFEKSAKYILPEEAIDTSYVSNSSDDESPRGRPKRDSREKSSRSPQRRSDDPRDRDDKKYRDDSRYKKDSRSSKGRGEDSDREESKYDDDDDGKKGKRSSSKRRSEEKDYKTRSTKWHAERAREGVIRGNRRSPSP